ncbi:MAG: M56 family metallopeptidase [Verrucomicrobiota bacterium]
MNPISLPTLSEFFVELLLSSWRGGWLILLVLGLRLVIRRRIPAQVWFLVWGVVALRLLVPASVTVEWSPFHLTPATHAFVTPNSAAPITAAPARAETPSSDHGAASVAQGVPSLGNTAAATASVSTEAARSWTRLELFALVWLAGVAILASVRTAGSLRFRRRLRAARPADDRVLALVESERRALNVGQRVVACETAAVEAPALFGVWQPRLLLPVGFASKLTDAELRLVVRHELAHCQRRDLLMQAVLQAGVVLHWFNPLAWLAVRAARTDCELACDAYVLERDEADGALYGATLLKVLGVVREGRRPGSALAILEGRRELAQRVRSIAGFRRSSVRGVVAGLTLVAALAVAGVTREARGQADRAPAVATSAQPTTDPVEQQRQLVEAQARELQTFKESNLALDRESLLAVEKLTLLEKQAALARSALAAVEQRVAQIAAARQGGGDLQTLTFIADRPQVDQLTRALAGQRRRISGLSNRYRNQHPEMIRAASQRDVLERELSDAVELACKQVESERDAATQAYAAAMSDLNTQKQIARDLDRQKIEQRNRERRLGSQEKILQAMIERSRDEGAEAKSTRVTGSPVGDEFTVSVVGAVNAQGAYRLRAADRPIVLDAIARAGGFAPKADRSAVTLIRAGADGSRAPTALRELELMQGTGNAGTLARNDVIVVGDAQKPAVWQFSIVGAVKKPGFVTLPEGRSVTWADAIALGGGATENADLTRVGVVRRGPNGENQMVAGDIATPLAQGIEIRALMEPGEIMVVPERAK